MDIPKTFIHYGHELFDPDLFMPIKNREFVKPHGGLWASSLDSPYSWKEWCISEDFRLDSFNEGFIFQTKPETKIYVLDTNESIKDLPKLPELSKSGCRVLLDFEKLAQKYDGLYFSEPYGELRWVLYGWDCESLLVMHPENFLYLGKED